MEDVQRIRNICILAHVDHGKTTLADHLIAGSGSGLLHPKQAGRLRFMDYLDEEQRRAITMKSSSVCLQFNNHFINLIDSPGHIDFCSEVSSAARLSDGALILVDAVEGVHIQTHAVLRQAWIEKLTPCLVLNKIDRLIIELKMTPMEAYNKLLGIVHEVNGIMSTYKAEKYLSDVDTILASAATGVGDENQDFMEDDVEDTFQPQKGNVAFTCALDGWGFRINEFAEFYVSKFGASAVALQKALWGPHYFDTKSKMIVGKKKVAGSKVRPMFVQHVLEPLWQVYHAALDVNGDKGMLCKVIKAFNLSVPTRELQNNDLKAILQAVMSRWLPLSNTILSMVVKFLPDPSSAQSFRLTRLLPERHIETCTDYSNILEEAERVRKCVAVCDTSSDAPCVAFVSKMFAVPFKLLPPRGPNGEVLNNSNDVSSDSDECFLAFARIFSGSLFAGQKVFVLQALYDPINPNLAQRHVQEAELHSLYLMMGQGLKPVAYVKAGNVVAIRGLGQYILKSATLSSRKSCWPFSAMFFQVAPTLRVAIEPSDPADIGALTKGLKLLNRADPFVEVTVSSRGEQVLAAAGEVHLDRCIKDLKERFAKVSLEVSPPIVSYKETIEMEGSHQLEISKILSGSSEITERRTPNGRCVVRVQIMKFPNNLAELLDQNADLIKCILEDNFESKECGPETKKQISLLKSKIKLSFKENDIDEALWLQFLERLWALGPHRVGPNILLTPNAKQEDKISSFDDDCVIIQGSSYVSKCFGFAKPKSSEASIHHETEQCQSLYLEAQSLESSVISGFQLATAGGPLCDEPMWGLAFLVETCIYPSDELSLSQQSEQQGNFAGQVMTAVKEACRAAMLRQNPRLVEALYFCELNTPTEYLGSMYAVLARRRARILKEEMREGSPLFTVHAYVPASESFGFVDELRRRTSGASSALLGISHWETLSGDPFFVPRTDEEIEEFGDGSSVLPTTARKLIDAVRRRKGLPVEEKVVEHATKQRTLARKV